MLMDKLIKVIGRMVKYMEMENIVGLMDQLIKEILMMAYVIEKEKNLMPLMDQLMKVIGRMVKNMEKET
jgi:hypothetical protein